MKNEKFLSIVGTKQYTVSINGYPKTIMNTNELLGVTNGVYGVKTGFTNGAGRCLVSACKREDLDIITVVIGADTKNIRTTDSKTLINYAFENFEMVNIEEIIENEFEEWKVLNSKNIIVNKRKEEDIELILSDLGYSNIAVNKNEIDLIKVDINYINHFEAPIFENTLVGSLRILINNNILQTLDITNKYTINKKESVDYFSYFFKVLS